MKLFSTFIKQLHEAWEHPFTGPDAYEDDNFLRTTDKTTHNIHMHSLKLLDHYGPAHSWPAVRKYTHDSNNLNMHLLHKHDPHLFGQKQMDDNVYYKDKPEHLDIFHDHLHDVMSRHTTPHDMHVYSGTHWSPARYHDDSSPVIKMHMPAFTSTSISPDVASVFTYRDVKLYRQKPNNPYAQHNNILKIHVPADSHSFYVHGGESELILPSKSKLHIHPTPTEFTDGDSTDYKRFAVWHAKLVHDGFKPTRHMPEGET